VSSVKSLWAEILMARRRQTTLTEKLLLFGGDPPAPDAK
jgi:hypothetical protein